MHSLAWHLPSALGLRTTSLLDLSRVYFSIPALVVPYKLRHKAHSHTRTERTVVVQQDLKFNSNEKTTILESHRFLCSQKSQRAKYEEDDIIWPSRLGTPKLSLFCGLLKKRVRAVVIEVVLLSCSWLFVR